MMPRCRRRLHNCSPDGREAGAGEVLAASPIYMVLTGRPRSGSPVPAAPGRAWRAC